MGSGNIVYKLTVPYKTIKDNSQAFTSFSQVGGWCYKSTLSYRKAHLQSVILKGEMLNINELKQTSEKPQEILKKFFASMPKRKKVAIMYKKELDFNSKLTGLKKYHIYRHKSLTRTILIK